ncbi:Neurotransmitter-gated ion-channel ligand-binding domain containing protein [Trichostrongylus colubriformis]|uniref:Neurotransmitter-gated ion-channel ligand-binding domain containing protein n=1 Tax=Trichostrongylus colubriformis TaxID=6319 RepID=A0AAN8G1J1_TRICO
MINFRQSSQDFREDYTKFVRLSHTGHMVFFVPTVTSTLCSIKVRDFPFDSQECSIKMISHSFATTVYGINMVIPETLYSASPLDSMGNGEWHMNAVAVGSKRIEFDDAAPVIVGSFDFSLERNPAFYVAIVITPSFVINIICILGLFLSGGNVMSKLGMALTNIMSLTFILGILASVLPKTDQLPKIGVYVVVNLALITGSLIIVLLLPYLPLPFGLSIREKEEKEKGEESDNPKTNRYVNIALLILLQLANLTNVLVLVL